MSITLAMHDVSKFLSMRLRFMVANFYLVKKFVIFHT